ncbi:hypothetical protein GGS24DRAFT_416491 [Hypoxylon argillaceum]|nr:hypothetical protein GGS24DRAFT_416491 [Hypoxylon argillaceum]
MAQLPDGTVGDAVGVLIFTFTCLFTNILLLWLYWKANEKLHYVALIGYFALLCTISSIIQQIYNYTLWTDLLWQQLYYIKANYQNADVIFQNGNFGFMRVLAIIRLFCYIVETGYLLSYCLQIYLTLLGFWESRKSVEFIWCLAGQLLPILGGVITIGLLQTPAVQSSFVVYLIVANVQSLFSCSVSILLLFFIVQTFVQSRLVWRRLRSNSGSSDLDGRQQRQHDRPAARQIVTSSYATRGVVFDDNWLVLRLSVAIILISGFIVANIVTHLPQRDDILRDAQSTEPDLGPGRARSNIIGYIFGVTPGLAIWLVFGLSKAFRRSMYDTFIRSRWWRRKSLETLPPETYVINSTYGGGLPVLPVTSFEGYGLGYFRGLPNRTGSSSSGDAITLLRPTAIASADSR